MRGIALIAALALPLAAQAAEHRLRVYPNSLTISSIAQGPDGWLWLAAEDGLYRFDGFHYHKITAYPFSSARFVAFTKDGSLWAANFEGLARVRNSRFEVLLKEEVSGMAAYPDQIFVRLQNSLARVGLDGSMSRLKLPPPRRDLTIDSWGKLWFTCESSFGCSIDPNHVDQIERVELPPVTLYAQVLRDSLRRMWASDPEHAYLMENGRVSLTLQRHNTIKSDRPGPLLEGRNGQLWFLGETVRGLNPSVDFRDRADHDRYSPISGLEDPRGHLWVASFGQGLVEWIRDPKWRRWFPEDFGKEPPVQVLRDPQGATIVATQKNLYRQDAASQAWSRFSSQPYRYYALLPLANGDFLASIRDVGVARISPQGTIKELLKNPTPEVEEYRGIFRDKQGRLWVGAKRTLFRIEGQPGSLHLREEHLPDVGPREKVSPVDLELDANGRLWVGYQKGIAWLDERDQWHKIATDQPVTMLRGFALAGDDLWVSYRRIGPFSLLHRDGDRWKVRNFAPNDGYPPAGTEFIKRDSRGWIWRGTSQGVFLSDGKHVDPNDWIHMDVSDGLAANEMGQYGFFEDPSGAVWLNGDEGVSRLEPDPAWFDAPRDTPPKVTRIDADGRIFLYPDPLPTWLPAPTKVLRVDAGALNAPPFRIDPLRYRLRPIDRDWRLSHDGSLEFHNLPDGDYRLELSFAGNGPAPVAAYPFRVGAGRHTLFSRWWVLLLAGLAALAIFVRYAPGLDRLRFRVEKTAFLLRRRFNHRSVHSPSGAHPVAPDHSGETLLGRYHLSRVVSRGGFSMVYEARDLRDGNARLAVKILNRNSRQEGWVRDRFAHEVTALRSVEHPGVVPILDSWISTAGEPCLAMPFLDGKTLRAVLEEAPLSLPRAGRIIRQLGAALTEVHSRGIVHRDLKPENLILLHEGSAAEQVVILDFGTAGLRSGENELAATTLMSGSFHYMAPERLTGRYSPASDLFSLAVIILEILTGKRLANLSAVYSDASFHDELESALHVRFSADAARQLADLLAAAYNPDPRLRPSDVADWVERVAAAVAS